MELKWTALVFLVIGAILGAHLFCSCTSFTVNGMPSNIGSVFNEAFSQRNALGSDNYGAPMNDNMNGNNWETAARIYANQVGNQDNTNSGQYYNGGSVPLPPGELLLFAENEVNPECCPSFYTSSTGCVCASKKQIDYLNKRGGNRTMDSEF
jgi:hypothetical protein